MSVRTDVRIIHRDGTNEGRTLFKVADAQAMPIPAEYTLLRIQNEEGMYMVVEQGVMYYFAGDRCNITITVDRVMVRPEVEEEQDEG